MTGWGALPGQLPLGIVPGLLHVSPTGRGHPPDATQVRSRRNQRTALIRPHSQVTAARGCRGHERDTQVSRSASRPILPAAKPACPEPPDMEPLSCFSTRWKKKKGSSYSFSNHKLKLQHTHELLLTTLRLGMRRVRTGLCAPLQAEVWWPRLPQRPEPGGRRERGRGSHQGHWRWRATKLFGAENPGPVGHTGALCPCCVCSEHSHHRAGPLLSAGECGPTALCPEVPGSNPVDTAEPQPCTTTPPRARAGLVRTPPAAGHRDRLAEPSQRRLPRSTNRHFFPEVFFTTKKERSGRPGGADAGPSSLLGSQVPLPPLPFSVDTRPQDAPCCAAVSDKQGDVWPALSGNPSASSSSSPASK